MKPSDTTLTGIYQAAGRDFGFITPEGASGREEDLFVPPGQEGSAWHGDTVAYRLDPPDRPDGRPCAHVTAVLGRANTTVVGAVRRHSRENWLVPDGEKLRVPILLVGKGDSLRSGDKIAAKITSFGTAKQPPMGRFIRSFGRDGSLHAAVEALLFEGDIVREFPEEVLTQTAAVPQEVPPEALEGRLDLREETIITIDGASSKDLDDAVSLTRNESGVFTLGVHIADVSHYVPLNTPLDQEAFQRGASVYFADQVIPMLPPDLSNGICSLNPRVDRLTLSCIMTLDKNGVVTDASMHKSVIRTTERMTYEDCNILLSGGDEALAQRYRHILPMLRDMAVLSEKLSARRRARGALDLEQGETVVRCDALGQPIGLAKREPGVSEGIIESFMLQANECVARYLKEAGGPGVYRVHERPSAEKAEALRTLLAPLGYPVKDAGQYTLQKLLDRARGTPEEMLVHTAVLRSMMKARYDPEPLGHFGLAAEDYCHFTSPIRRYPDLMIHRILKARLEGTLDTREGKLLTASVPESARQSSRRELAAQTAEREIDKRYVAAYMATRVGDVFQTVVSGVTRFGLFLTTPEGAEGFLGVERLPGRHYDFDDAHLTLTGPSGASYTLGQVVEAVCLSADPASGRVEFARPEETFSDTPPVLDRRREERPKRAERRVGKRPHTRKSFGGGRKRKGKR